MPNRAKNKGVKDSLTKRGIIMKKFKNLRNVCSAAVLIAGLGLGACTIIDTKELRHETVKRIANPAFMLNRTIMAEPFELTVYERVHERGGPATIYIEGDGLAWLSKKRPSFDPTPKNPVALQIASRDSSTNVIYLARPCQYSKMTKHGPCDMKYWMGSRFAPEVINSMNTALDNIKSKYGITEFNLVGFSGGGNVAALLTAQRNDVVTLRTVAGNLDHEKLHHMHEVSQIPDSLNAKDIAPQIANIPQHHFIGEWDEVVTPAIYDSFRAASGPSTCMRSSMVKRVDHENGWVNVWEQLLAAPLDCNKTQ